MIGDLNEYKELCKRTCSDTFYKPYLDAQEAKNIYEVINMEYSPIPIPARRDIDNLKELCRTEEFIVVRHSIGNDEEFITVGNTVERTPGSMSCIYHELFNKKDRGWEEQYGDLAETMIWDEHGLSGMRSLDQFKSTLGSASNTGGVKPFQFSSARQPSAAYSNSSGSFASLMLTAEKLVKEQASAKTDLELAMQFSKCQGYFVLVVAYGLLVLWIIDRYGVPEVELR
ncbi:hypothetical protein Tco_1279665 [Tanacetum coccineum]